MVGEAQRAATNTQVHLRASPFNKFKGWNRRTIDLGNNVAVRPYNLLERGYRIDLPCNPAEARYLIEPWANTIAANLGRVHQA